MIVSVEIQGGLGNQLFQIAAALHYAERHGHSPVFPNCTGLANNWGFDRHTYWDALLVSGAPLATRPKADLRRGARCIAQSGFRSVDLPFVRGDVWLSGYFQSWEYVGPAVLSQIRGMIFGSACAGPAARALRGALDAIRLSAPPARTEEGGAPGAPLLDSVVSLHVRRGDYLQVATHHTNLAETDYYEKAVAAMPAGAPILVFSDDPEWCRANAPALCGAPAARFWHAADFTGKAADTDSAPADASSAASSAPHPDIVDMIMMAACRHHVMANSSFSWWAAALGRAGGAVAAPAEWFAPGMRMQRDEWRELYKKEWLVI